MAHMSVIDAPAAPEVTLGWRLRMAMEKAGLSREYMAARLGVRPGTITRWTHDESPVRYVYLERWADLCDVPLPWLVSGPFAVGSAPAATTADTSQDSGGNTHESAALAHAA